MFSDRDLLFQVAESTDMPAFSGQYAKKVLLVALDEPEANDNQLFVQKLLQAANIQLASDTFFCFLKADEKLQLGALIKEKQPDQVLLFGLNPAQLSLHLQIKPYQLNFNPVWLLGILLLPLFYTSWRKHDSFTQEKVNLQFSTDTVFFDTINDHFFQRDPIIRTEYIRWRRLLNEDLDWRNPP